MKNGKGRSAGLWQERGSRYGDRRFRRVLLGFPRGELLPGVWDQLVFLSSGAHCLSLGGAATAKELAGSEIRGCS